MRRPEPLSLTRIAGAPPPGALLCRLDDLVPGQSKAMEFRDGNLRFEMFIHREGNTVFAYQNRCPHAGTPLDWEPGRFLDVTGAHFLCGTHGARFRIDDGYCVLGPCAGAYLRPVAIELRADGVYVPAETA